MKPRGKEGAGQTEENGKGSDSDQTKDNRKGSGSDGTEEEENSAGVNQAENTREESEETKKDYIKCRK